MGRRTRAAGAEPKRRSAAGSDVVCLCRGTTERQVRTAIRRGAGTVDGLAGRSGAGTRCGGCLPALARLLVESAA